MHLTIHRKPIRSIRIRVSSDGSVTVSAPKRLSDAYINSFIESKKEWIEKALARFKKAKQSSVELQEDEILLHGHPYSFVLDPKLKNNVDVDHEKRMITSGTNLLSITKQKARYKLYAKKYLIHRAKGLSQRHGMPYEKTYIRDQKTKRGTCSTKKNIGLNWKLVKMPEEITEYVICHELAHLKEMNHSKRFWTVVESFYPDYKAAVARMKKYGLSLQ